jgi:hypothetical protein
LAQFDAGVAGGKGVGCIKENSEGKLPSYMRRMREDFDEL